MLKKCQLLSEVLKLKRIERLKKTFKISRLANEKLFTAEAILNCQNNIVLSKCIQTIPEGLKNITITQKPASLMIWTAVSSKKKSPLNFVPTKVKINSNIYINVIFENGLIPLTKKFYSDIIGHFNRTK